MKSKNNLHTVHIPVMGTAFSIDTPIKVAQYGLSSVISLVDDNLIEEMRGHYCKETGEPYIPITKYEEDYRARRITEYLNLVDRIVKKNFEAVRSSCFEVGSEITKYFELLPDTSPVKELYQKMLKTKKPADKEVLQAELRAQMRPGDINVNIMTKLDRTNFDTKTKVELPMEFSDALAALRGYAQSTLSSAIVFSAGINRRLYSYAEKFKDFYADTSGAIKKKIILKVSDYRSSIIQGKFFAKKGLWISEFRVESGLNCGGHAFISDGFLMGPILEEFKKKRQELIASLHGVYNEALKLMNQPTCEQPLETKITAQGGIGTATEDKFLRDYYELDGTGWATPFLLVPEVTNVDDETRRKLSNAGENDVYLSDVSPLGVPFNNLRNSASDVEKYHRVELGRPGSACPKSFLVSNTEFTEKPICTASRQYQKLKIEQLQKLNLEAKLYDVQYQDIIKKACICADLGEAVRINYHIGNGQKKFTAICPGPNIAYFSKIVSLKEIIDHIYGRINLLNSTCRPHMFIKELKLNIDYFMKEVQKVSLKPTDKQIQALNEFKKNLLEGINYYFDLYPKMVEETQAYQDRALEELQIFKSKLEDFVNEYTDIFSKSPTSALVSA